VKYNEPRGKWKISEIVDEKTIRKLLDLRAELVKKQNTDKK